VPAAIANASTIIVSRARIVILLGGCESI